MSFDYQRLTNAAHSATCEYFLLNFPGAEELDPRCSGQICRHPRSSWICRLVLPSLWSRGACNDPSRRRVSSIRLVCSNRNILTTTAPIGHLRFAIADRTVFQAQRFSVNTLALRIGRQAANGDIANMHDIDSIPPSIHGSIRSGLKLLTIKRTRSQIPSTCV